MINIPEIIAKLLRECPLKILHGLGIVLGKTIYTISSKYRNRLKQNLRASGLFSNDLEYNSLLKENVAENGKSLMELPAIWFGGRKNINYWIKNVYGVENIQTAANLGKGIVLVTPHIGCFEIISKYLSQKRPITVLYRPPKLSFLSEVTRRGRETSNIKLAETNVGGVRKLYKALRNGETIGILPDQVPAAGDGEWATFFGRRAYTMTLVGRLNRSTAAPLVLAYVIRLPRGQGYEIFFKPFQLDSTNTKSPEQQLNIALETIIKKCPAQYLWSYNRFKKPAKPC